MAKKKTVKKSRREKAKKNTPTAAAFPGLLEEMTIDEVRDFKPEVVVLPLGSTEPHGSHLPYGTDTYQVTRLARLAVAHANQNGGRVLLYPTLPITNNANFRAFPFALRISIRTLMQVMIDIVTQCKEDGVNKILIVNGHGGNPPAIDAALREIAGMKDMPFVCQTMGVRHDDYVSPIEYPSDHAGEDETSRMMWLRPDLVRESKLRNNPLGKLSIPALAKTSFVRPWHLYVPTSAGGETSAATPEKGQCVIESSGEGLGDLLADLSKAKFTARFPYE